MREQKLSPSGWKNKIEAQATGNINRREVAGRDVPQIISGELAQPFQGSLIARIFLLNPAGLPVTLNLDHNLRLAKLWVSPIYSKLNPPLYVGENRVLFPSCPNPN